MFSVHSNALNAISFVFLFVLRFCYCRFFPAGKSPCVIHNIAYNHVTKRETAWSSHFFARSLCGNVLHRCNLCVSAIDWTCECTNEGKSYTTIHRCERSDFTSFFFLFLCRTRRRICELNSSATYTQFQPKKKRQEKKREKLRFEMVGLNKFNEIKCVDPICSGDTFSFCDSFDFISQNINN